MATDIWAVPTRTEQLQAFFEKGGHKGYATSASLRRAMPNTLAAIAEQGLAGNFEVVEIARGQHAGRVLPVLVFGPAEPIPAEAVAFAHSGVVLFQYRR